MTVIRRLAALSALLIVAQILLGAAVRLTGSGLACPDWPLCYGLWFPTPSALAALPAVDYTFGQVMAEWLHRFNAAALVAPALAALAVAAWRARAEAPALAKLAAAALLLLLVQAGLGGFTVLDRNSPWSVAAHLGVAMVLLAAVLAILQSARAAAPPRMDPAAAAAAALIVAAALAGAMTAKAGATLACPGWPLCGAEAWLDPGARLNLAHRLLAALAVAGAFIVWRRARRRGGEAARLAECALAAAGVQVVLGAVVPVIFAGGALWPQVLAGTTHQAVAIGMFACLAAAALSPPPRARPAHA